MTLNLTVKGGIHQPVWNKKGKKVPYKTLLFYVLLIYLRDAAMQASPSSDTQKK